MSRITSVESLRNTQHGLTNPARWLINGNPLYVPEASESTELALINPNPKGGDS